MNIHKRKLTITFDKELTPNVLNAFNKGVDKEGYLIEKNTFQRVLTKEGEDVLADEFAGITKGSEIYLKSDIASLISYVEYNT